MQRLKWVYSVLSRYCYHHQGLNNNDISRMFSYRQQPFACKKPFVALMLVKVPISYFGWKETVDDNLHREFELRCKKVTERANTKYVQLM